MHLQINGNWLPQDVAAKKGVPWIWKNCHPRGHAVSCDARPFSEDLERVDYTNLTRLVGYITLKMYYQLYEHAKVRESLLSLSI